MATHLTWEFAKELPYVLKKVSDDLGQLLDIPVEFSLTQPEAEPIRRVQKQLESGAVCCRVIFSEDEAGIGGVLFSDEAADLLTRSPIVDSAEPRYGFEFPGFVEESMSELWDTFIGSWNQDALATYRMSTNPDERSVDYLPVGIPFPDSSGVFPDVLPLKLKVSGQTLICWLFLPLKVIRRADYRTFAAPRELCPWSLPAPADEMPEPDEPAEPDAIDDVSTATPNVATTEGIDAEERSSLGFNLETTKLVAFLDYAGVVLPWLRQQVLSQGLKYVLLDSDDTLDDDTHKEPQAVIAVGMDEEVLKSLPNCIQIAVRPRD